MHSSTVTVKGQVTIPATIRKKFGLQTGGKVSFSIEGEKIVLHPVPDKVEDAFGLIAGSRSVSLDDMEEIIKKRAER